MLNLLIVDLLHGFIGTPGWPQACGPRIRQTSSFFMLFICGVYAGFMDPGFERDPMEHQAALEALSNTKKIRHVSTIIILFAYKIGASHYAGIIKFQVANFCAQAQVFFFSLCGACAKPHPSPIRAHDNILYYSIV